MSDITEYTKSSLSNEDRFKELVSANEIVEYQICDCPHSLPTGCVIVDLPNGEKGIAISVIQPVYYAKKRIEEGQGVKKVKILKLDGTEYMDLSEIELTTEEDPKVKITSDDEFLYVTTSNTKKPYLAKYKMITFERVWKKDLGSASMQSITTDQNSIICFNMANGSIDYFDKDSGEATKTIDIKEEWGHSQHNITTSNFALLAGTPGMDWISNIPNQLKTFNEQGSMIGKKDIPTSVGILGAIGVDPNLELLYLAFENKIAIFNSIGYVGGIDMPVQQILGLNVDKESSALMVSSINAGYNTGGKIDILSAEAVKALSNRSNPSLATLEVTNKGNI